MYTLYMAKVKFEENDNYKKRPVLLLRYSGNNAICRKVTSQPKRPNYPGEVELLDWKKEGLHKLSVVRMSKHLTLDKSDLIHKIGDLTDTDQERVENEINTPYKESYNIDDEIDEYLTQLI